MKRFRRMSAAQAEKAWKEAKHANHAAPITIKGIREKVLRAVVKESPKGVSLRFPTFSVCMICGGHLGENTLKYNQGIPVLNCTSDENYLLALIQYGYYLAKWEGTNTSATCYAPRPCKCKCKHQWEETFRPPTPRSGIHGARCVKCGMTTEYDTSD